MALILATAGGCSTPGSTPEPASAPFQVNFFFGVMDGSTHVDAYDLTVLFKDSENIISDSEQAELASHLILATWPEKTAVAWTTEMDVTSEWPWHDAKVIRVVPDARLENRWYWLEVVDPPSPFVNPSLYHYQQGSYHVRFRPGSDPRVRSIRACQKDTGTIVWILDMSEPVEFDKPAAEVVSVAQNGETHACEFSGTEYDANPYEVSFTCAGLKWASSEVTVGAGLTALTGIAVPPGTWTIDVNALPAVDGGFCRELRTPI